MYLNTFKHMLMLLAEIIITDMILKLMFDCRLIAVTGGIGSGKSTFCEMLKSQSRGKIQILSLDLINRKLQEKGTLVYWFIKQVFYSDLSVILQYRNIGKTRVEVGLDRGNFRRYIMDNKAKYSQLNRIMMPFILIKALLELYGGFIINRKPIVMEIPLLLEKGLGRFFIQNVLINAKEETQISRLKINRDMEKADVLKIMENQISNKLKKKYCCKVIENEKNKESLEFETKQFIEELSQISIKDRIIKFNFCSILLSTFLILLKEIVF